MPTLGQNAPRIETVLTLPQEVNGQTENITEGPDGSIYVTAAFDRILWKIKDGKAEKFFTSPKHAVLSGVAWDKDEVVVSALQKSPFPPRVEGQRGFALNKEIGSQSLILDKAGKVKATVDGHDPQFFNGLAWAGDHWYLITDTAGSQVLSLDTKAKSKRGSGSQCGQTASRSAKTGVPDERRQDLRANWTRPQAKRKCSAVRARCAHRHFGMAPVNSVPAERQDDDEISPSDRPACS
jgi:hypothetical protein